MRKNRTASSSDAKRLPVLQFLRVKLERNAHFAERFADGGSRLAANGLICQRKPVQIVILFDDNQCFCALPARDGKDLRETSKKAEEHCIILRSILRCQQIALQRRDVPKLLCMDGPLQHVQRLAGHISSSDRRKIRAQRGG